MTTKAIIFLGNIKKTEVRPFGYDVTSYTYQNRPICTSPFVAEAVVKIFRPDQLYVVATTEAYENHFDDLKTRLADVIEPQALHIPTPQSDEDIWRIFEAITAEDVLRRGDEVVFDVTNGFRSIPIFAFLASSYLRIVRQTKLVALTYAEFVPGLSTTPIRDLSAFVRLLDWTAATDAFTSFGRSSGLSKLLTDQTASSSGDLTDLAEQLDTLSLALHTSRPAAAMQTASQIQARLGRAQSEIVGDAQPFRLLLDQIKAESGVLGLTNPLDRAQARDVLQRLLSMIEWYVEKDLLIHAMTFAREWLVSLVVYYLQGDLFDGRYRKGDRSRAEEIINAKKIEPHLSADLQQALPEIQKLWKCVADDPDNQEAADLRNDLAHCGMRHNPRKPHEVAEAVRTICTGLSKLMPT